MRHRLSIGGALLLALALAALAEGQQAAKVRPSMADAACPDLSGTYRYSGEDGMSSYTLTQMGCRRLDVRWETGGVYGRSHEFHRLILDGEFRRGAGWFGSSERQRTSARFRGQTLVVTRESARQPPTWVDLEFFQRLPTPDMCVANSYRVTASLPENGLLWGNVKNGRIPHQEECHFSNPPAGE